jgi:hypothetical protein
MSDPYERLRHLYLQSQAYYIRSGHVLTSRNALLFEQPADYVEVVTAHMIPDDSVGIALDMKAASIMYKVRDWFASEYPEDGLINGSLSWAWDDTHIYHYWLVSSEVAAVMMRMRWS